MKFFLRMRSLLLLPPLIASISVLLASPAQAQCTFTDDAVCPSGEVKCKETAPGEVGSYCTPCTFTDDAVCPSGEVKCKETAPGEVGSYCMKAPASTGGTCVDDGGICATLAACAKTKQDNPKATITQKETDDCKTSDGKTCCILQEEDATAGGTYGYEPPLGISVTVPQLVARIIAQVLPLVGALFLAMFVYGGFLWMTASGDEKKVGKARTALLNAVVGMAIVMGAYTLVYNIIKTLGQGLGQ